MSYPMPEVVTKSSPPEPVFGFAAGLAFRSILLAKGKVVGQHDHDYAHATFIAFGLVRGWKNGQWIGDKVSGQVFEVEAGAEHCYQALEDSFITCVHDEESALSLKKKGI